MDKEKLSLIRDLAEKYLQGMATEEEKQELHQWYDNWQDEEEVVSTMGRETAETIKARILSQIQSQMHSVERRPVKIVSINRSWQRVAAVAAILILLTGASYLLFFSKKANQQQITNNGQPADLKAPVANRAMIMLANGNKVFLDSAGNGIVATQGNLKVIKTSDGQIVYTGSVKDDGDLSAGQGSSALMYNTLTNPRGSRIVSITLSDGTQVWLNSESSLKYPIAFSGNERKVEITGEAYFEVTHNEKMPFKVKKGDAEVEVLGTHFNFNGYDDESTIKVTLLEGAVKVTKDNYSDLLNPGQQAQVGAAIKVVNGVNLDEVIAWKNGLFSLDKTDITAFMHMVSRWYDVEIVYEGSIPTGTISGEVQRSLSFSQMQKVLQLTDVHFRVEGKKLIVIQ